MGLSCQELLPEHHPALLAFFDRPDQRFCYCRYWDFPGSNQDWLACASGFNREACVAAMAQGELHGSLAWDGGRVGGWLRWQPADELPKLQSMQLEIGPAPGVASLLCFSVASELRGQGVARGLLRHALVSQRAAGFLAAHAYPKTEPDGAQWTGPEALFRELGFAPLRTAQPRSTWELRLEL